MLIVSARRVRNYVLRIRNCRLRRSGIIQLAIKPDNKCYNQALEIKNEYVLKVEGTIIERESKNKNLNTGEVEVDVTKLEILNNLIEMNKGTIIISHDRNVVEKCSHVLFIDNNNVIYDTHSNLLKNPNYSKLIDVDDNVILEED